MSGREFMRYVGELHGLKPQENNKRADELLELVELKKAANRRIGGYSRGMRQRLGVAQALVNRPSVLFMDEPTSALDPIGRREILALIQRLTEYATIFMSTHILSDVERVCSVVGIVDKGKLLTVSTVEGLREKYARSVFEIEFIEDAGQFADFLKKVPWVSESKLVAGNGDQKLRVRAAEVEKARKELPHLIAGSGLTLCRYELVMPDLEEIFMEILSSEGGR
jgi:ABC-2 type transport system ATP-binding protein